MIRTTAIDHVIAIEGGLVNDPHDPGGITNHGISIRFAGSIYLDIDGDGDTDAADIIGLTVSQARAVYKKHFWDLIKGDDLPPAVAFYAFDQAVNQGIGAAVTDMQRAAGVPDDGVMGPQTRLWLHKKYSVDFLSEYHARRMLRYGLTNKFGRYGLGWTRRATGTLIKALSLYDSGL